MGQRDDGAGRSDSRIPLILPWQAGARRCRAGTMRLPLRPPTDLRGIPAALVSLSSHGAGGNGTALPKAADTGPRGDMRLAPGAVTNTAEQNYMTQHTQTAAPVQHHAA